MFLPGNPKRITELGDLQHKGVVFANRQQGSGTRVLLDLKLQESGISVTGIAGYEHELDTHLAVASSIASGKADTGLGIAAAARSWGLDFLPLFRERYDLVMLENTYRSPSLAPLVEMVASDQFRALVDIMGGYDTSETGKTIAL
jgi:putative molybdopterin biosynthesis protein